MHPIVCLIKFLPYPGINQSLTSLTLLVFLFFSPSLSTAGTLLYHFTMDKDTAFSSCIISKTQQGTTLSTEWRAETLSVKSELLFDFSGNEQSWKSINIREGTNVTVTHAGDSLVLTGTFRCKPVLKAFPLKGFSWKQMIPFDLVDLAFSADGPLTFATVALMGPYALKTFHLRAKRIGDETIFFRGTQTRAVHIRVSPVGFFSALWHGDYWFRKSDRAFIRSESTGMPGRPGAIMELIREK